MERTEALAIVEKQLKRPRYEHTIRVMETALELAELYGADQKKVELAAIFHDYAKYRDSEEMKRWIISEKLPQDLLDHHVELWHGPVGSKMIQKEVGIYDESIASAIYWHTTGTDLMGLMDKIIFIADYIEPGRDFPGVEEVREMAYHDLDEACWMAAKNTIQFLMSQQAPIYPDTMKLYNKKMMYKG
ncbi:metal dependent phosphohydrolase [Gracilibacillus halophilus YIM-C55.5]|uniref:bis(5'-nucleosyl)-tetraphosphatase (symmetrical) n=1 Tax=Gracilibacillus halophilus YIM-C55.5 TaxID=1308866 RepID=N4WED7_9BACI|nr:bis(5'-nucleosyl)-tetraphosphatase (symmetrical) YqeK [Gracilibacillus halophilus]ENH97589.1 metal dependent phosphohydrolase [Gracilibacillus halophilus YIM-C55.5]